MATIGSSLVFAEEPPIAKPTLDTAGQRAVVGLPIAQAITKDSQDLTLEEVILEALANNPEFQAKRQELEAAKAQLLKAVWPNPELESGLTTDALMKNKGEDDLEAGISQAIPWSGRIGYQKQAAKQLIERTAWDIQYRQRLLTLEVTRAFTQVLALQEQLKVLTVLIQINRQLVETATARFQRGEVSQVELQVARVELQQGLIEQQRLQTELKTSVSALNLFLGRPKPVSLITVNGQLIYQPIVLDVTQLTAWALEHRPDVLILEADIRQSEALLELAKAQRFEDLKTSTFFQRKVKDDGSLLGFKVSIALPIFDRKKGEIKEASVRREIANISKEFIGLRVEREIEQFVIQLTSFQEIIGFYEQEILTTLDESIRTIQNAYVQGQVSFFEVIQTEERLINFKRSYVEALMNYVNTRAELTAALGGTWPEITDKNAIGSKRRLE